MPVSLSKALSKVRNSAKRLNQLTDQANKTIKEIESFLNEECSVGMHAWVVTSKSDDPIPIITWLEYRRVGPRYRIAVVTGPDGVPEGEYVKAWSDCSRDQKLATIGKLSDLIVEIGKKLEEKILNAEKGLEEVSETLQAFSRREG